MRLNRNVQKLLIYLLRVGVFLLLFRVLILQMLNGSNIGLTFDVFLKRGLLSLQAYDSFGNKYFDFVKLLLLFSIYILGYLRTIVMLHDLSDGYARLIQIASVNRKNYLCHRIFFILRYFILDWVVWLLGFTFLTLYGVKIDYFLLFCLFLWNMLLYINLSIWVAVPLQALIMVFLVFFSQSILLSDFILILVALLFMTFVLGWTKLGVMLRKDEQ